MLKKKAANTTKECGGDLEDSLKRFWSTQLIEHSTWLGSIHFFDEGELFFIQILIYGIYYSMRITAAIFKTKSGRNAYSD